MGDWGVANMHQIAGWMAAGLRRRTPRGSTFVIHTLGPYQETLDPLLEGVVDFCTATPLQAVELARRGLAFFQQAHPELRAIAALPHRDRLVLAVAEEVAERLGVRSFSDLGARRAPLTLVGGEQGGRHLIGHISERVFTAHGMDWHDLERWGGRWIEVDWPHDAIGLVASGEADGLFFEAIMNWHALDRRRRLRFLPMDPVALERMEREYLLPTALIEPGEFEGVAERVRTLDFSQWLLTVRAELPDWLAAAMAQVVIEDRSWLEGRYSHRPLAESPLQYPIQPELVCQTEPVPLHPGAQAYYLEIGALSST